MRYDYDLIILGGGSAGIVSGVMAGGLKMRTLLIEKSKMGGECLNTGCVPSKALLHAANVAHTMRTAASVGLKSCEVLRAETAGALRYARETIGTVREADATEALLRHNGVELRRGEARFDDAHRIILDGAGITAEYFILATGSRPATPAIPGLNETGFQTNQTIFDLDAIPETLLMVGGGPVGVEMAQAFQRLGSRVTLVSQSERLLPHDDSELSRELESILRAEGMDIRLHTKMTGARPGSGKRVAMLERDGEAAEIECEEFLLGVGRVPNVEGLQLERAGVQVGKQGVKTDSALRTTAPNIYAAGDVQGEAPFSHMAEYEAKIAVRNIVFPGVSRADLKFAPWTTFTDPEVAHVGMTEEDAKAQGIRYEVYRQPFAQNDRALTDNYGVGFVKVLTHGMGGKILGAHILGPRAGELIQEWAGAIHEGRSMRAIADRIHVYPTLSMASQHVAQRWYERKAEEPLVEKMVAAYAEIVRPRRAAIGLGLAGVSLLGAAIGLRQAQKRSKRKSQ